MAWHDATCATLDLEWEDGQPACRKCERKAPKLAPVHPISPPAPPPDTSRSELICTWPPSLFSQGQAGGHEDSDTLARILANIDEWTGTTSTRPSQRELNSDQQSPQQQPLNPSEPNFLFQGIHSRLPNANSIRLLRLRGSEDTSHPVCGTLENHRLHDPCRPIFEAFSYTWADSQGNSSLCETIFLGPQYDVLPVTTNCLAALRRFRTVADRLVWVDAICINQFDLEERGHQVSLMRDIYTSAARVLTYLGDKHDLLDTVAERSVSDGQRFDPFHEDLKAIVRMPYFSRIWVVQELLLSKTASLTFDDHTMHWTDFSSHVKSLTASKEDGFYGNWVGLLSKRRRIKDLMSALQITQDCRCSDPRDRVYGLMGLVDDEDRNNLPIDYELSVQQLYTGLTMYWLTKPGSTFSSGYILHRAFFPKEIPFLPSWVPDWTSTLKAHTNPKVNSIPVTQIRLVGMSGCDHSSGLSWFSSPFANERDDLRHGWSLDDNFWNHVCSRGSQRSDRSAFLSGYSWGKLAMDAGWKPDSPARLLPANGILALDAVHILSIREGKVEIIDTDGKSLQGLYVAGSDRSNSGETHMHPDETDLHIVLNWQRPFLLKRDRDGVYSLNSPCRIFYTPEGPLADLGAHRRLPDIVMNLGSLETRIVERWLINLFFFGVRAGTAFATSIERVFIQQKWFDWLPVASDTCLGMEFLLDRYAKGEHDLLALSSMIDLRHDIMYFVRENEICGPHAKSQFCLPALYEDKALFESLVDLFPDPSCNRDVDTELATRLEQAEAAWCWRTLSMQEMITSLKGVVKLQQEACRIYPPLDTAMSDLSSDAFRPRIAVQLPTNLYGKACSLESFQALHPLLLPIVQGEKPPTGTSRFFLDGGRIIQRAWSLLKDLTIDVKYTLQQNLSVLWIHVLTMEMVARLRGVLQQRLILKAIRDKMKNVQSIYLI
jgi:hypothetical protein